jgi:hypothetical protein
MAPCLQGQHRPSAQVRVTWRFDAPDSTAMLTPRRSSSLAESTRLRCLHDDFDAALTSGRRPYSLRSESMRTTSPESSRPGQGLVHGRSEGPSSIEHLAPAVGAVLG